MKMPLNLNCCDTRATHESSYSVLLENLELSEKIVETILNKGNLDKKDIIMRYTCKKLVNGVEEYPLIYFRKSHPLKIFIDIEKEFYISLFELID